MMNNVRGYRTRHHSGLRLMRNFNKQFNSNHIFVIKEQIYAIHRPEKIICAAFRRIFGRLPGARHSLKKMLFLFA